LNPSLRYRGSVANDFPYLLVRASRVAGTVLDVALLLQVEPTQVYRWIAGIDLPADERIGEFRDRLQSLLYSGTAAARP
jgi:hypothetical protein